MLGDRLLTFKPLVPVKRRMVLLALESMGADSHKPGMSKKFIGEKKKPNTTQSYATTTCM